MSVRLAAEQMVAVTAIVQAFFLNPLMPFWG
jgi:hypothetical protein